MQDIIRIYSRLINEFLGYFPSVAIIGPRQCGKTTLLKMSIGPDWKFYDLEDGADYNYISEDPDLFFRLNNNKVALDEAQIMPELFPSLRVTIDKAREQKGRFLISGSSSPNLLESISESLAGRVGIIEMSPLLLAEIAENKNESFYSFFENPENYRTIADNLYQKVNLELIHKYWFFGGYPEPWVKNDNRFYDLWYAQFVRTYMERDISKLFPLLNKHRFRQFIEMLAGLSSTVLNYSQIARALSVSQTTVREYFKVAHGTFIWRQIYPYEKNVKKRIVKHPKGYMRDSGVLHYLLRINDLKHLLVHHTRGFSWESMVIEEILRGLEARGFSYNYYYYRTSAGAEVDLIVEGKFGLLPIEIKYSGNVKMNTLLGIRDFIKEHHCPFGIVINNDSDVRYYNENLIGIPFSHCI